MSRKATRSRPRRGDPAPRRRCQPPSAGSELVEAARARRATSGSARCFAASKRAALSPISVRSSLPKTVHEPVVKSCSRVPTAQHDIGVGGEPVGVVAAGDADRADVARVVGEQATTCRPPSRRRAGRASRRTAAARPRRASSARLRRRRQRALRARAGPQRRRSARPRSGRWRRSSCTARLEQPRRDSRRPRPGRPAGGR